jgi:hypothetical protein
MKQLLSLFLFLVPCLAWAQYPSNGNQKITLGEQTTADGLIYRGVLGDTALITPLSDTSAYIILDTVNHRFYNYNRATNVWSVAGGGTSVTTFSGGTTGLTPSTATSGVVTLGGTLAVANGGTNATTLTANKVMVGNGTGGVLTPTNLHWDNTNSFLGVGISPSSLIDVLKNSTDDQMLRFRNELGIAKMRFVSADNSEALYQWTSPNGWIASIAAKYNATSNNQYLQFRVVGSSNTNSEAGLAAATKMTILGNGNVGIGQTTPTAVVHLKAGTATASSAPLKFTSGTNLTTAEAGAMEFNGTNLFFSPSTTRHTVNHGLTGSATLDFPSTLTLLSADLTITVTGAADGDVVSLGVPNAAVNANTSYSAWVSAANTVTVRFNNYSAGTVNPASGLFKVFVTK